MNRFLDRTFALSARQTDARRELVAGLTTFLTLAYIIAVNPLILSAALGKSGIPTVALVAATCLAGAIPCLIMGLWANFPLALAPGMGLNAFLAYSIVLGQGVRWQTAMGVVFVEGVIIAVLVALGLRERLLRAIPDSLKVSIGAGIGLFIAFIGLQNAGWVVKSDATLIAAGSFRAPSAWVAGLGLVVTVALMARRVRGALLLGIVATAVFAALASLAGASLVKAPAGVLAVPDFQTFGKLDIAGALSLHLAGVLFAFLLSDLFDTMGTVVAVARQAGLENEAGEIPHLRRILLVDSFAASWGGICGASSVTSYIESGAGVAEGGRTGLTSVTVGALFLVALLFAPLVAALPKEATVPALLVVGFLMIGEIRRLDFSDPLDAFPAFLTLIGIPLTYSIARGIALGVVSYVLLALLTGRASRVPSLLYISAALLALSFV